MAGKIRQAYKEHSCSYCDEPIKAGQRYLEVKRRFPRFDDPNYRQTGVEYVFMRVHSSEYSACIIANEIGDAFYD